MRWRCKMSELGKRIVEARKKGAESVPLVREKYTIYQDGKLCAGCYWTQAIVGAGDKAILHDGFDVDNYILTAIVEEFSIARLSKVTHPLSSELEGFLEEIVMDLLDYHDWSPEAIDEWILGLDL